MDEVSPLLTDLYQLTMLQGYFDQGMKETALFEFFVRKLPPGRNFLMAAGLEQLLDYLEHLHFTAAEIEALSRTQRFSREFLNSLAAFRFTGVVDAIPEGTLFFPDEPVVRVSAPLPQAQLIETRLINLLHFQTLIASKASRMVLAAPGKLLFDFGLRRAHGAEAGLFAARAAYLAGMAGTATVLAGSRFGIPLFGTMAHSFIQAHDDEREAFLHFAESQPGNAVFLLDTYDTEAAAEKVVSIAPRLQSAGIPIQGVRLDSGDLAEHARRVRKILDAGGLREVKILASGNLDEFALSRFLKEEAPIDGFGVGTRLDTSADAPSLDAVYKLQAYAGRPRRKRSEGKETWPGRKQLYRRYDDAGRMAEDLLCLEEERWEGEGEGMMMPVMRGGRRLKPSPSLTDARARAAAELARLPEALRLPEEAPPYPVTISWGLRRLAKEVDRASGQ